MNDSVNVETWAVFEVERRVWGQPQPGQPPVPEGAEPISAAAVAVARAGGAVMRVDHLLNCDKLIVWVAGTEWPGMILDPVFSTVYDGNGEPTGEVVLVRWR